MLIERFTLGNIVIWVGGSDGVQVSLRHPNRGYAGGFGTVDEYDWWVFCAKEPTAVA